MSVVSVDCATFVSMILNSPSVNDDRTFAHEHHPPSLDSPKVNKNSAKRKKNKIFIKFFSKTFQFFAKISLQFLEDIGVFFLII